ncbi:MAG: hypothetical protein PHR28_08565 [candidate division Zixibacteria bacterium]|nr:hypothetical protein [candidate division Zixibacteria bacterium]
MVDYFIPAASGGAPDKGQKRYRSSTDLRPKNRKNSLQAHEADGIAEKWFRFVIFDVFGQLVIPT